MTLTEIEKALWQARKKVFDDDGATADAAQAEVKRLQALLRQNPETVRQRDALAQARDERLLFLWL